MAGFNGTIPAKNVVDFPASHGADYWKVTIIFVGL